MNSDKPHTVYIVGAGPGDPDLLTVKAFRIITQATVILYDNLVTGDIINLNNTATKIYVGRKYGDKSNQTNRQQKINELMLEHHLKGEKVVRLKSGDAYVYGRAAEEVRYLKRADVPFEVVPGITAALAAANLQNVPITERGKSNAIMICTAHTADYSFEQLNGIATMLKTGNTLAIYMGLKAIDKVVPALLKVCKDPHIPINAISCVSHKNEKILTATLGDIQQKIKAQPLAMPVVFIVGVLKV